MAAVDIAQPRRCPGPLGQAWPRHVRHDPALGAKPPLMPPQAVKLTMAQRACFDLPDHSGELRSGLDCSLYVYRLRRAVFERIDESLIIVGGRVARTRERLQESKRSLEEIQQSLEGRIRRELDRRAAVEFDLVAKRERIAAMLLEVDQYLELSASSLERVQEVLALGNSSGFLLDTEPVDQLLDAVTRLRGQLDGAVELTAKTRERTVTTSKAKTAEGRIQQTIRLALPVISTLSDIDNRFEEFEKRLAETRMAVQNVSARLHAWLLGVTIGITCTFIWMAAGQVALLLVGRRGVLDQS